MANKDNKNTAKQGVFATLLLSLFPLNTGREVCVL